MDVKAANSLVPVEPFPDSSTKVHTLTLSADYRVKRNTSIRLGYLYEHYSSEDWAVDGVSPDSFSNLLTLGDESPNYDEHLFWASVVYRF